MIIVDRLNEILRHEHRHFNFYLQALLEVKGMARFYLKPLFEKEMMSELEHIRQFGDKVVALGGIPVRDYEDFEVGVDGVNMLKYAIFMEKDVLKLYHEVYPLAERYGEMTNDMSIVLMLEENIEHTTADVEEMQKLV